MPSPNFVGREAELAELDQILRSHPGVVVSAIAGMGGLGKTELAVQYATHHLADYPGGICWLNGRIGDLGAQVVQIVTREFNLELPQERQGRSITAAEQVAWCWDQWLPAGAVLVVLDDVATWDTFAPIAPQSPRFRTLMTTREQDLARQFPAIALDVLPLPKAVELLEKLERCSRVGRDRSAAEILCELVGRLPLGIELVGRCLASDRFVTLPEMVTRLRQKGLQDPAFKKVPNAQMTAQFGVKAAFELSWERLAPEAQRVARLLGYFALDAIPWAIAEQMMQVCEGETYTIRLIRTMLDNTSIVQVEEESLEVSSLHPLIQQFVREKESEWIQESSDRSLQDAFMSEMVAIARQIPEELTSIDLRKVKWARSHLEEVAEKWKAELKSDDLLLAFLGLARFYEGQGLYAQAEIWCEKYLTTITSQYKGDHPNVALGLENLAYLYRTQGKLSEAEPLHLRSLEIRQCLFESDHPDVALSLNNLAGLYEAQKRLSEAEPLFLRSLEIRQRLFKGDHPDIAQSLNNLALLYEAQKRLSEAELLYLQSLEMKQRLFEGDHPDVATSFNNLAGLYEVQERLSEAESLYLQSLEMKQRLFEDNHPIVATSLNNLGGFYCERGRLTEAEPLLARALAMREEFLGNHHPHTIDTRKWLAIVHAAMRGG